MSCPVPVISCGCLPLLEIRELRRIRQLNRIAADFPKSRRSATYNPIVARNKTKSGPVLTDETEREADTHPVSKNQILNVETVGGDSEGGEKITRPGVASD